MSSKLPCNFIDSNVQWPSCEVSEPGISPSLAPHPGVVWKRNGIPIAAPPSEKPEPTPPADRSPVGGTQTVSLD